MAKYPQYIGNTLYNGTGWIDLQPHLQTHPLIPKYMHTCTYTSKNAHTYLIVLLTFPYWNKLGKLKSELLYVLLLAEALSLL